MVERFLGDKIALHAGDCLTVLPTLAENSIDSCCCDPPYHLTSIVKRFGNTSETDNTITSQRVRDRADGYARLTATGFMGKVWDGGDIAFRPETWAAVYRVLKPGAHLIAMGGTRTYHRLACAIEDAGFEIRDTVSWLYGSGFPKNHSVSRSPMFCQCAAIAHNVDGKGRAHSPADHTDMMVAADDDDLLFSDARHSTNTEQDCSTDYPQDHGSNDGQPRLSVDDGRASSPSQQYAQEHIHASERDDDPAFGPEHIPSPAQRSGHLSNQDYSGRETFANGGSDCTRKSTSRADISGSASDKQGNDRGFSSTDYANGLPRCQQCGKPIADGLGTSLKPACELCVLARKPLSEPTVAANCLRWGTGAINVDGCRIEGSAGIRIEDKPRNGGVFAGKQTRPYIERALEAGEPSRSTYETHSLGRWPANVVHDGSDEVVAAFPDSGPARAAERGTMGISPFSEIDGRGRNENSNGIRGHDDNGGSAARFFYTSKANADDRLGSKHPTVKPLDLMQWLVRLITPPKGIVLDCFAGTGTLGEAAWREGMSAVLIEAEPEYQADIRRRMALALAGPDERQRESIRARNLPRDDGPLFGGLDQLAPLEEAAAEYNDDDEVPREREHEFGPLFAWKTQEAAE